MDLSSRLRRLLLLGAGAIGVTAAAAALFPSIVYDQFLWKYFAGPVAADAANQATAVYHGVTAHRGYNIVNELVYGLTGVYSIAVVVEVLRTYDVGRERGFVLWFVPFIVFGGLVRVVEDAALLSGPLQYLFISPIIYGTVFAVVAAASGAAVALDRRGVASYGPVLTGAGTAGSVIIAAVLFVSEPVAAAWMLPATLGLAAVIGVPALTAAWYGQRFWTGLSETLTWEGVAVLSGHLVDGAATALSIAALGYGEKHPVTAFVMEVFGTPYSFPLVKAGVVLGILGVMHGADRDDDPLFYNLILLGILAVGLGPGTRNLARAVFGV